MRLIIDPEKDSFEDIRKTWEYINNLHNKEVKQAELPNEQQQETGNKADKKYFCNNPNCKKDITKDVVAYCLNNKDRFNGKVYCRECQEGK